MSQPTIVTDGLWRKSLSAIRSLGKAGYEVTVMGESWFTTGFWSRFANGRVCAPTAARDVHAFGQTLLALLKQKPGSVILPMEDASLLWISENRERVAENGRFLIPPPESLKIALDKARTLQIAQELNLPCPRSWEPENAQEFARRALELDPGSFITKPRVGSGSTGVSYGEKRTVEEWEAHWLQMGPMLIQERIPTEGRGQGVSLLMDQDGECVAAFAHERLQQYPNSGGPSTDRHGILAPALIESSVRLLKRLQWRGIAMVEWKVDPRDGVAKLMEINPRFWGSLELAVRSGVDFPALYVRAALGEKLPKAASYSANVRCRWMMPGEILRYLSQPRERRESLLSFLKGLPGMAEEWDWRDLRGGFSALICTAVLALNPRYWKYLRRG